MSVRKFRQYLFCNLQKLQKKKKLPAWSYIIFFARSFLLSAASDWPGLTSIDPDSLRGTMPPITHAHRRAHTFLLLISGGRTRLSCQKPRLRFCWPGDGLAPPPGKRPHMKESVVFEGPRDQFTPPDCHTQRAFCLLLPKNPNPKKVPIKESEREKQAAKSPCCCGLGAKGRPASPRRSRNRLRWIAGLLWAEGSKAGQSVGGQYLCGLRGCRENNHSRLAAQSFVFFPYCCMMQFLRFQESSK